ncbi:hypothetical protein DC082_06295 [Ignatzschineria indica]|uniref:Uncharacterized protein n=1 Tax=Ignatzschineria indica TaxID=472583 RepID=A0A2U2AJM3_9GAMM|nr:hypothetical protein DC082_06295 [Ignatzschineria indica]
MIDLLISYFMRAEHFKTLLEGVLKWGEMMKRNDSRSKIDRRSIRRRSEVNQMSIEFIAD